MSNTLVGFLSFTLKQFYIKKEIKFKSIIKNQA